MASKQPQIAVLVSGSGSNLQAILDTLGASVVAVVISNVPDAYALTRAIQAGVPTAVVSHAAYSTREAFEVALLATLAPYAPALIVLAGFMRVLTPTFITAYAGRIINIHPSLLPRYPGLHTHAAALAAKDAYHGATVHFVTPLLDGGPIIAQARVPVDPQDTPETLAARVLIQEHRLYPQVIQWFCAGRLKLEENRAILDGTPLGDLKEI